MRWLPHLEASVLPLESGSGVMDVSLVLLEVLQPRRQILELRGGMGQGRRCVGVWGGGRVEEVCGEGDGIGVGVGEDVGWRRYVGSGNGV